MLFHFTLSHSVDNCPIFQKEMFPNLFVAAESLEGLSKESNIKMHFLTVSVLAHIYFALLIA